MLEVQNVSVHFGGVKAVDGVSLKIERGSITGLIGPNGAGKTTLFNVITGLYRPNSGSILLDGVDITGARAHELFAKGILRTFQIAQEFSSLTVCENLLMVPEKQFGENLIDAWINPKKVLAEEESNRHRAFEVMKFLEIDHLENEYAGNLSGGQKKLLELGRTMMTEAKIVFLDEVGAGVNRSLLSQIGDLIMRLNSEKGYTFCMIEHDMQFITKLCDPVIVMAEGKLLTSGSAEEVKSNNEVIEAYLGKSHKTKNSQNIKMGQAN